jgi:uncharacterized protein YeaO (DUF488 family)
MDGGVAREVRIKRIYEPPSAGDGYRVLVDRLWPRGLSRERARVDEWVRELAPSDALRRWFGHDPARFDEFRERYRAELCARTDLVAQLRDRSEAGPVTIVYAARDEEHNNAAVLAEMVRELAQTV